ncbi:GDSL-type esterase/lipase family protein [Puia sp.]|jgi:lysophospholipase L1-like esterase|uniref:GDSL-type esterase/lipase family protein n=1 Tax=Puia sp. TaxID=2045100 RepID=UPI002F3F685E
MKKQTITLLAAFLLFTGRPQAQTTAAAQPPATQTTAAAWDSTYRPATYGQRLAQFKAYPNSTKDVIFLGNSITAGVDWDELLQLPTARNRGISGDITFGVLQRIDEVTEGHPAKVFILIGINDISRNIPDSVITANHERMIRAIQAASPKTAIYFQTLMPVNNNFTQHMAHYNKDQHIKAVNDGIKRLVAQYHLTLVDLHPHFLDKDGRLNADYTMDGLHLNEKGYQVWKSALKSYL